MVFIRSGILLTSVLALAGCNFVDVPNSNADTPTNDPAGVTPDTTPGTSPEAGDTSAGNEDAQPESPTTPGDTSGTPSEPTQPVIPVIPVVPVEPEQPQTPTEPEEPAQSEPTVPEQPTQPEIPTVPVVPTEPENPATPEEPAQPEMPQPVIPTNNMALTATATTSYVSPWETLDSVNDNSVPAHSNDTSQGAYGNWNHPNSWQWVQYTWPTVHELERTEVFWFDDNGGVLTPTQAHIEYWDGAKWQQGADIGIQRDTFNALALNQLKTNAIRITMRNSQQSTGILEWRVMGKDTGVTSDVPTEAKLPAGKVPYQAITDEFVHLGITTANSGYRDTDRFRSYHGEGNKTGPTNNLAFPSSNSIDIGLAHIEAAYECLVNRWGFRSASLPAQNDNGPYYKFNIYNTNTLTSAGAAGWNEQYKLSFMELRDEYISSPHVVVHEYGHALTMSAFKWNGQAATGAWWESLANWFAEAYLTDPLCAQTRADVGLPREMDTIINLDVNIASSHLAIVHIRNYYQAWPFLAYLTNNPDGYPGLGRLVLKAMMDNHKGNNETPLHVLQRLTPVSVQDLLGQYWARMAYVDIANPKAQARFFALRDNSDFQNRAYANLAEQSAGVYQVRADRQPQYGGANITPLDILGGEQISVAVTNLGNGLADSNFTAMLSIRDTATGATRYQKLANGNGNATIKSTEEVALVVVNTPNNLYQFNAFESNDTTIDYVGLNYQVQLTGARPKHGTQGLTRSLMSVRTEDSHTHSHSHTHEHVGLIDGTLPHDHKFE